MRVPWALAVLTVALPLALSGQSVRQEVTSLRFEGNTQFSGEVLSRSVITRETQCRSFLFRIVPFCLAGADFALDPYYLNDRVLREDYARIYLFYFQRGFREVAVDTLLTRPSENEVEITFRIREGTPIRVVNLDFSGVDQLPDSSVLENLPIEVGDPYSVPALLAVRDTVEARLRNRGFAYPMVLLDSAQVPTGAYEAQMFFRVDPGPLSEFGELGVEFIETPGVESTVEEEVVLRMLPFRTGDLYREDLRFEGRRTLYNLDIFRQVNDSVTSFPNDPVVDLTIRVAEGDSHRVRTGAGFSTADCVDFQASWSSRNFMGGARRLQVSGRVANVFAGSLQGPLCGASSVGDEYRDPIGSLSIDFTQPYFYSPRNSITARIYAERQSFPEVFLTKAFGLNVGLTRTLAPSTFLSASYRPRVSELGLTDVLFCSAYLICDTEEIGLLEELNSLSPVGVSFSRDRRNQILNPSRGYLLAADLEHADGWTASEFRYTRVVSEAVWYAQPRQGLVVGARLRGGFVNSRGFSRFGEDAVTSDILHPEKRLYAGGANSVRGYAQNRLGPQVLYLDDPNLLVGPRGDPSNPDPPICTSLELADLTCDAGALSDTLFLPRPRGGTRLLEGSLEVRFPLAGPFWEAATFLDFGQVWDEETTPDPGGFELTPGLGVRYFSPIGPIRVDLGYRFATGEDLPVVTQELILDPSGVGAPVFSDNLVQLATLVRWGDELERWTIRRFQLHLSIGQAF
ncbi:MAG: BamA/TamA family outer membrane protein [Gemmatimonadetes bacterium]|nr:BamA/TamA family outer membrane protein [Gemmatimonadota bacterium]